MKLAFSTNAFTNHPLPLALREIAAAGFGAVEILADRPHAFVRDLDAAGVATIRNELDRLGLAVSNVNANCTFAYWSDAPPEPFFEPSLISPNARHRADRIELICRTIDLAAEINSPAVSITTGRCLAGMPPARAAGQLAESIRPVLDHAQKRGVNVGIESEPGLFIEHAAELADWIDRLGSPRLGANLDIGHSVVLGEGIDAPIRRLAGRIWNMHVEDLPGQKHYHMVPGDGDFDWLTLKATLDAVHYDGYLTVELYTQTAAPADAARRSHAFLWPVFAQPMAGQSV